MSLFLSSIGVKENRKILLCKKSRGGRRRWHRPGTKTVSFGAWQALRKKEWAASKHHDLIRSGSRMGPIWAGPAVDRAYLVGVIDCCTSEIVGWNVSHLCRTEEAVVAVEEVVLNRLPAGSRESDLIRTTGMQLVSRSAYHSPVL